MVINQQMIAAISCMDERKVGVVGGGGVRRARRIDSCQKTIILRYICKCIKPLHLDLNGWYIQLSVG
jgi:hypothetical protein